MAGTSLALDDQVCFALAIASRRVIGSYRELLAPMRLTHPQYLVMLALWEQEPRGMQELGSVLALDPGTLSPLLKRLEALGYLSRSRRTGDERYIDVALTDDGRALRQQAEVIPATLVERLGVPLAELEALRDSLQHLIGAIDANDAAPRTTPKLTDTDGRFITRPSGTNP
ncbi:MULTISPECIES: MarR family winged helix-turn-helix transcriptional regulator [unclassified Curtobacterium]|uniref:MarR family winged helix-turn-helix transcriptional regulator n=1 Tax=unclassified Curtobacterium TaxID=257496 RepID=UPI00188B99FC|nr:MULTISPECIES: MarR family transcriptional regulator [unclassified Curtobacterium]MBF4592099.1 MarR family transcriptional regulator [Curtobacterium sp. VKM Ac-1395]MCY1692908.1 MarR family transcriptional regulator [Curtobacterium sp. SL109]